MTLLYVYIATMIIGGMLLLASLLLSDGSDSDVHAEADPHLDLDLHADVDAQADIDAGDAAAATDLDAEADIDADGPAAVGDAGSATEGITFSDFWLPFTSLRFWVFFLAFFGLTGTVLSLTQLAGPALTLASASGLGFISGFAAAFIVRRLRHTETGTVKTSASLRGKEAVVLLPVGRTERGKVRLSIDGSAVDLLARTADEATLPVGERVLIIDLEQSEVIVVRSPTASEQAG